MPSLFDPIQVGDLHLPNRIFMAPLTRLRGTADHIPTPIMVEYYTQRTGAGLIISEGIPVDPMGVGYQNVPGIWSPEQVEAWKPITRAVHERGGHIFAQIWHVGRISDPELLDGRQPVAPSAIAATGHVSLLRPKRPYPVPRALETVEVKQVVEAFRRGAQNAQLAGFDGVHLHSANGYLLDQFLQDGSNHRTDEYGGPLENRARLLLESTDAAISVFGSGRVGVHLAPRGDSHGISDSNPTATFSYVAAELGRRKIAFIAAREHVGPDSLGPHLKQLFGGIFVANEAMDQKIGQQLLDEGKADAVAFGKLFIANPDLPARFARNAELNRPEPNTFYAPGPHGYTDYPSLAE
ncbi:alkene reductase [Edaphobacter sp. 12200R-103]|jgi:2,4-dienoyl-CoA reductase-like NADH-dependent reductase (Old Yellow Enzyme family)|uniref:alkene reductase n=1 Tax=Edaphobacter sp. 12200R-103 TaxID=2703788 RepID=UPI00138CD450|nr:alkene reductase [Edaphobacter sp. 12200R-103]QHS52455.1 alkene reductase [Edaphobacter sp. 12200R-103]